MITTYTLGLPSVLSAAIKAISALPPGWRIEIKEPRRSEEQNRRLWSLLGDFADQVEHMGRRYSAEQWKVIFMHALGQETKFLPSLDGKTFIPCEGRSSRLSVKQMSELQELIVAEGSQRGVSFKVFHREDAA
jgi:hypothetical protein